MKSRDFVESIRFLTEKYIGQQLDLEKFKADIVKEFSTEVKQVTQSENCINFEIEKVIIKTPLDEEMGENDKVRADITQISVVLRNNAIMYLILEQKHISPMIESIKQRYIFDKENELFVSTVKMDGTLSLFNLPYETMIKYNDNFFFQERHMLESEALDFNNGILDKILTENKTIEDIKELYEDPENEESL